MAKIRLLLSGLALCLAALGTAAAVDPTEILEMVRNDIEDSVIVNMVKEDPLPRPLNSFEVIELNKAGASTQLLKFLTGREAIDPNYTKDGPQPIIVAEAEPAVADGVGEYYVDPNYIQLAPDMAQTPGVLVTPPTMIYDNSYYYYDYDYDYDDFWPYSSFYWGNSYWRYRDRHRSHRPPPPPRYNHRPPRDGSPRGEYRGDRGPRRGPKGPPPHRPRRNSFESGSRSGGAPVVGNNDRQPRRDWTPRSDNGSRERRRSGPGNERRRR